MSTTSTCGILRCIRVRPAHRGEGISHQLLAGAVDSARDRGAPAIEGYPVDNRGEKVDLTMAYVGHGVCSSVPASRTPPTPTRSSKAFPGY